MSLEKVVLLNVPKIPDKRGNLSFLQSGEQAPFAISRVCLINDIPSGAHMDGLANVSCKELVIALSGSFDVLVSDGKDEKLFSLNRPDVSLYIPEMIWRQLLNFSTNSVAMITIGGGNHENITDFSNFQKAVGNGSKV